MLQSYVSGVSDVCCKCFSLDVSKVDLGITHVVNGYTCMFQSHVSSVSSVFVRMLQMFHMDVSKVDQVLHILKMALVKGPNMARRG
jgi:hypothetical protein